MPTSHGIVIWPEGGTRPQPDWFDPAALRAAGRASPGGTGRGTTVCFEIEGQSCVLRHYRRGGLAQWVVTDRYWRAGLHRSRPWRELALLARLHASGMPVPPPIAARVAPTGLVSPWYRGDLVTGYLAGTRTLTQALQAGSLEADTWSLIGATIARFHAVGVDHADLNAHNVLLDEAGAVHLIDFDRAVRRARVRERWCEANLARLRRSLNKLQADERVHPCTEADWQRLLAGYRSVD